MPRKKIPREECCQACGNFFTEVPYGSDNYCKPCLDADPVQAPRAKEISEIHERRWRARYALSPIERSRKISKEFEADEALRTKLGLPPNRAELSKAEAREIAQSYSSRYLVVIYSRGLPAALDFNEVQSNRPCHRCGEVVHILRRFASDKGDLVETVSCCFQCGAWNFSAPWALSTRRVVDVITRHGKVLKGSTPTQYPTATAQHPDYQGGTTLPLQNALKSEYENIGSPQCFSEDVVV